MRRLGVVVAGAMASVLVSAAALAADNGPIALPATPPDAPLPPPPAGFSFSGPYVGTYGGLVVGTAFQGGLQGGYNFVRGPLLIGAEAQLGALYDTTTFGFEAELNLRLGAVLGERLLVYTEAGVGLLAVMAIYTAGGGIEIVVGQSLSVFAEAKAVGSIGGPFGTYQVQGGVNWHPNY